MSPIESAVHDKSILDSGVSSDDRAAADVMMMMMSVRPTVGGSSRNRESAEDDCDGRGNPKLIHDLLPLQKILTASCNS